MSCCFCQEKGFPLYLCKNASFQLMCLCLVNDTSITIPVHGKGKYNQRIMFCIFISTMSLYCITLSVTDTSYDIPSAAMDVKNKCQQESPLDMRAGGFQYHHTHEYCGKETKHRADFTNLGKATSRCCHPESHLCLFQAMPHNILHTADF